MEMLKKGETVRIAKGNKIIVAVPVSLKSSVGFDVKTVRKEIEAGKIYTKAEFYREALISNISEAVGKIMTITDEQIEKFVDELCQDMKETVDTSKYLGEYYVRDSYKADDNTVYVLCRKKNDLSIAFEFIYKNVPGFDTLDLK